MGLTDLVRQLFGGKQEEPIIVLRQRVTMTVGDSDYREVTVAERDYVIGVAYDGHSVETQQLDTSGNLISRQERRWEQVRLPNGTTITDTESCDMTVHYKKK